MLKNERDTFLFIANLSDYSLDDIPIGTLFLRDKGDFSGKDISNGHVSTYRSNKNGVELNSAIGSKSGIKAYSMTEQKLRGSYKYIAWPRKLGTRQKKQTPKKFTHKLHLLPY